MSRMSVRRCPKCGFNNPNAYGDVCWYCGQPSTSAIERKVDELLDQPAPAPPSDDDEPITREWFESEYGKNRIFVKSLSIHCRPLGHIWLDDEMQDGLAFLDHIRTRRQLRDLLAALGYRRER